ncbi:MAG TPA: hypothetical protein VMJ10_10745 [Kofleriaceae bacterium]|nr:hypothetical protein [Kofleriaceae bacterium]
MAPRLGLCLMLPLSLGLVACQPLYGGKPEHLANPQKKKKPEGMDQPVAVKYIDDCNPDFRDDPKKVHPQVSIAVQLVATGDTDLSTAEREKDDQKRVGLLKEAIDKYRNALVKDPWNIDATLKLAVTYDKTRRKGCALAMLKRLASLSANTKYAAEVNRSIDTIDANGQWFKDYHKEAMTAVGR